MRKFETFRHKDASYRISIGPDNYFSSGLKEYDNIFRSVTDNIIAVRSEIENYIDRSPEFLTSFEPVELLPEAPEAVKKMAEAADLTGLGPMASVAGVIAEAAARRSAEAAGNCGFGEIIIENGGDIFIHRFGEGLKAEKPVIAGIFSGLGSAFSSLALKIEAPMLPLSVCSSSSHMGHSASLGSCDLSTVFSENAALADSAATLGGNLVKTEADLQPAAERIAAIRGVSGVLLIKNRKLAAAGRIPELIRHSDPSAGSKITKTIKID